MNQTQNPNLPNFNNAIQQNMNWNMQNQGLTNNPNNNQMQAMLMKQFYLQQQTPQSNLANNPNAQNNMLNQMQNNNPSTNPNISNSNNNNIPNNYQQMLLNNQQQQMINNQNQKLNNPQNMLNFNLMHNTNLQTAQKDQFLSKFPINNFNINNMSNRPSIPNHNNNFQQPNNNFNLNNNPTNMPINPEFLSNLAFMNQNTLNNKTAFSPSQAINPNFMQNNNNPQNFSLNNPNISNNELPSSGAANMDMLKLIQDAISNLKSKGNSENQAEKIQGGTNNVESDISYGGASLKNEFESVYSLEDENLKQLWSGFLTKNKKDKVCVDAYQIRHECSHFFTSEFNLNVSHRTQFEEIMKRPIIGVIAFSPQNETQCENFQDYINYFKEKDRAGVVNFKSQATMYIVPPGDFSRKFYQNPKKHLLGIFVDSSIDVEKYVDMNQLKLPPPVISSAEKKLLLKEQKNKQLNTSGANANLNLNSNQQQNLNNAGIINTGNNGNLQGFGGSALDAMVFNNLNNEKMNKPNTDYDELIKILSNEEKGNLI